MKNKTAMIVVGVAIVAVILFASKKSKAEAMKLTGSKPIDATPQSEALYSLWVEMNANGISDRDQSRTWRDSKGEVWRGEDASQAFYRAGAQLVNMGYTLPPLDEHIGYHDKTAGFFATILEYKNILLSALSTAKDVKSTVASTKKEVSGFDIKDYIPFL